MRSKGLRTSDLVSRPVPPPFLRNATQLASLPRPGLQPSQDLLCSLPGIYSPLHPPHSCSFLLPFLPLTSLCAHSSTMSDAVRNQDRQSLLSTTQPVAQNILLTGHFHQVEHGEQGNEPSLCAGVLTVHALQVSTCLH